jgi:hypothetical protein
MHTGWTLLSKPAHEIDRNWNVVSTSMCFGVKINTLCHNTYERLVCSQICNLLIVNNSESTIKCSVWRHLEPSGMSWSHVELSRVIWSYLEPSGGIWRHLDSSGVTCSNLERSGVWSQLSDLHSSEAIWSHVEASGRIWSRVDLSGVICRHLESSHLGGALRDFQFYYENTWFLIFGFIWHLGGFGSTQNTPTGCGSDLPTSLRIVKNEHALPQHVWTVSMFADLQFANCEQ